MPDDRLLVSWEGAHAKRSVGIHTESVRLDIYFEHRDEDFYINLRSKLTDETSTFLKGKGLTINEVDREAYRKATAGVYNDFRNVIGADLVDAVMKQVGSA